MNEGVRDAVRCADPVTLLSFSFLSLTPSCGCAVVRVVHHHRANTARRTDTALCAFLLSPTPCCGFGLAVRAVHHHTTAPHRTTIAATPPRRRHTAHAAATPRAAAATHDQVFFGFGVSGAWFRVNKMFRVTSLWQSLHAEIKRKTAARRTWRIAISILMTAHWFGCVWWILAKVGVLCGRRACACAASRRVLLEGESQRERERERESERERERRKRWSKDGENTDLSIGCR